jgi:hypothetical protein
MSASVENSKDDKVAGRHPKIDPEGKSAHNRATDFTMNRGNAEGFDPNRWTVSSIASANQAGALRTTAARRRLLLRLGAEIPYRSRPVGNFPPNVAPANRGSRVGPVVCPTAIEFGALLRPELQFGVTFLVRQTFLKGDRKLGAFTCRQLQQFSEISR